MIYLMDLEKICKHLTPVTNSEFTVGKGFSFHPQGLFSEIIFGPKDTLERRTRYSYINLNCKILHPALISIISKVNKKILLAINRSQSYTFKDGILVEDKNGEINGITSIINNFVKIIESREEEGKRKDLQNMILSYHKRGLVFINKCLVIPAAFRDAEQDEVNGMLTVKPINDFYAKIIRHSNQLYSFTSGPIYEIFAAKMMSLTEELYNYVITKISKKEGLIRQSILGKRADFTGRAVITGGSTEIKVDEIGVPFKILTKIFEPFIIYDLVNSGNVDKEKLGQAIYSQNKTILSIPNIRSLISGIQKGDLLVPELEEILKLSVRRVIFDKVVLAKRDPAIHAESVQAFKPVLVDGDTIKLNILKCAGFNADFDGDQMAIFVPVTKEAIKEAREKMIISTSKDSLNSLTDDFSKDIAAGIYCLTRDSISKDSLITIKNDNQLETLNYLTRIKYDGEITTVGRVIFNRILPSKKFYINESINKEKLKKICLKIYNYYKDDHDKYVQFCYEITKLGSKYFTLSGSSFSLNDLYISQSLINLKTKLKNAKTIEESDKIISEMIIELKDYINKHNINLSDLLNGGVLRGAKQITQMLVSKGLFQDPDGKTTLIQSSYSDGFTTQEYFEAGSASRIGMIDRAINTSDTGYMSRQFIYALQRVEADPRIKDCGTKRFLTLKVNEDIAARLQGRYILSSFGTLVLFDKEKYLNKVIKLRSPLYCLSKRICKTCYGELLERNKTHYVGIVAAQILGETLTQTILRTFHIGGSVSIKTIKIADEITRILNDSEKNFFNESFHQNESSLFSKKTGKILLDYNLYKDPKKDIIVSNDFIELNYGYFRILVKNYEFDVTIDNRIRINLKDKKINTHDDTVEIEFLENSEVFNCLPTTEVFSEQVKIIGSLLSGKQPWKSSEHFCMKVYDQFKTITKCDLVHIEILVSNLLRDKGNPSFPARLNRKYNPTVINLKKIPQQESWLQSLSFENPKDSITTGLLYDRPIDETILEKIVTGNF